MGRRGPPPKPTKLRELEGNPSRRPLNDREPKPKAGRVPCPTWLSAEAKAEWRRIVPELKRLGLLTTVDRTALACYCQAHAELVQATRTLDKEGRVVKVPVVAWDKGSGTHEVVGHKLQTHPAVRLQRDAFGRVKQFLAEFGLTPASRSRLRTPEAEGGETDPFQELLNRAAGRSEN
jgi:P27 family predicted phage terminase small subunit